MSSLNIHIPKLRDYQQDGYDKIHNAWASGYQNVLAVYPTGAGKTVLLASIVRNHEGGSCVIAHRQELVDQISLSLAKNGVYHRIIGPDHVIRNIVQLHMFELGASFYDGNATCAVASVDTLVRRMGTGEDGDDYYYQDKQSKLWYYESRQNGMWSPPVEISELPPGFTANKTRPANIDPEIVKWSRGVSLWVTDEAHHLIRDNKWGRAITLFTNAKGLGVTATPSRGDQAGLGAHADGVFNTMILGPTMRELIDRGYLTEYDIVVPPTTIDLGDNDISKTTGDYKRDAMVHAVEQSSLVGDIADGRVIGDIVKCYQKFATGKLGVTFVPSVKIGEQVKQEYIKAGITAELVTAKTPTIERAQVIRKFKNRQIMVLINVDLFGEGFDLPAIEVVQMARPTASYGLYVQQFGRVLRLLEGKVRGLIIDHVGNVLGPKGHGLPDTPRTWTLDRGIKRSSGANDAILLSRCLNVECWKTYERFLTVCPHCGHEKPKPKDRSDPEFVDGDLYMLDQETLAKLRGDVDKVEQDVNEMAREYHAELLGKHCPQQYINKHIKTQSGEHLARKEASELLKISFATWAGYRRAEGLKDNEIYRKFYIVYGCDYMTALTLDPIKSLNISTLLMEHC